MAEPEDLSPHDYIIDGRFVDFKQLPADFPIERLRSGWFAYNGDGVDRLFLQADGAWGNECDKVYDTLHLAQQAVAAMLVATSLDQKDSAPYIHLNVDEALGVAECGCRLVAAENGSGPAFYMCPNHSLLEPLCQVTETLTIVTEQLRLAVKAALAKCDFYADDPNWDVGYKTAAAAIRDEILAHVNREILQQVGVTEENIDTLKKLVL